jgi:hypothetical protein
MAQAAFKRAKNVTPVVETPDLYWEICIKNLNIRLADNFARLKLLKAKRLTKVLTKEDEADMITRIAALAEERKVAIATGDVKRLKKLIAHEGRIINRVGEKEISFGPKCQSLVFIIANLVFRELEQLRITDPKLYIDYVSGRQQGYWFTTYTSSLSTMLNKSELAILEELDHSDRRESKLKQGKDASFRGDTGFYASLMDSTFFLDKDNSGNKVRLRVNLEWLFGFQNVMFRAINEDEQISSDDYSRGLSTGFSQRDSLQESKLIDYNENGLETEATEKAVFPVAVYPTIVGKKEKVKGENEVTPLEILKEGKEKIAPAGPHDNLAFDFAKDSAQRATKWLFNAQNVQNDRIQYNKISICTEITAQDYQDMPHWMLLAYHALKLPERTWAQTAETINEAIENTAKFLERHPTRWIYHPYFWLSPDFSGGGLCSYVKTYLFTKEFKTGAAPEHTPQVLWALENGADRQALNRYIRKFGEKMVSDVIAYCGVKIERGVDTPNGKMAYVFGVLKSFKPHEIQYQLEAQKAKLESRAPALGEKWTESRVHKRIKAMKLMDYQIARIKPDMITKIVAKATEKSVNQDQVTAWLEAIAQGKTTQFS